MSRKKDGDKIKLAEAKYITGESPEKIAASLGVSRRTVDRWAKDGNWDLYRQNNKQTNNVIQLQPKAVIQESRVRSQESRVKSLTALDDDTVIDSAIAELHAALADAEDKSKGGMAVAIARLVELRRKLKPESAADLVERAIELGIGPEEFLTELKNAWSKRA